MCGASLKGVYFYAFLDFEECRSMKYVLLIIVQYAHTHTRMLSRTFRAVFRIIEDSLMC